MKITQLILIFVFLLGIVIALPKQAPIIGIYTQTVDAAPSLNLLSASNLSYIAASYVKYIQISGAQVVPILAYSNRSYFENILPKLNGVLFTGGGAPIDINNLWTQNADFILKYAMQQNDKGKVYPIWGTCLGMQLIAYLTNGYDIKGIADVSGEINVRKTAQILPGSLIFNGISTDLKYHIENGMGILFYNHHFAVRKEYFQSNKKLMNFWQVEAYTTTSFQETFVAAFRAKSYPFFGVQFHPEKNLFQWRVYADRSIYGAQITQILSNNFVEYARQNTNVFPENEFRKSVIYNYQAIITTNELFQVYAFPEITSNFTTKREVQSNLLEE